MLIIAKNLKQKNIFSLAECVFDLVSKTPVVVDLNKHEKELFLSMKPNKELYFSRCHGDHIYGNSSELSESDSEKKVFDIISKLTVIENKITTNTESLIKNGDVVIFVVENDNDLIRLIEKNEDSIIVLDKKYPEIKTGDSVVLYEKDLESDCAKSIEKAIRSIYDYPLERLMEIGLKNNIGISEAAELVNSKLKEKNSSDNNEENPKKRDEFIDELEKIVNEIYKEKEANRRVKQQKEPYWVGNAKQWMNAGRA